MKRLLSVLALALGLWALGSTSAPSVQGCAFAYTPTTYEGSRDRRIYLTGLDLAAYNHLAPDSDFFGISTEEAGSRANRGTADQPYVPPTLLKAVAWIESNLWQAANSVPYQGVGPALISFDCGHGITQVTSGMTMPEDGYWPSGRQALVATHYLYNIARGSAILVSKWNYAPEARPVVGNGNPRILEDWYYALWSYNGFAAVNNPTDGRYTWPRTPYSCGSNLNDGYSHNRTLFPYQELVLGCASRPPSVDGTRLWAPQPVTLPNLGNSTWRDPISNFPVSSQMDFPTPWVNNRDSTAPRPIGTRAMLLGTPQLTLNTTQLGGGGGQVTISNTGSGVLSWRAKPQQAWIGVNKQGGVALGGYVPCGAPCPRSPTLTITVNAANAPSTGTGRVKIESLTNGQVRWVEVVRGQQPPPPPDPDSDWDGCSNSRELGSDPAQGGLRNPDYFWDFYDTPDQNNVRDRRIDGADLMRVVGRFGTNGDWTVHPLVEPPPSGYHSAFDRGPPMSARAWDAAPADGAINAVDIFVLISQLGHNCN